MKPAYVQFWIVYTVSMCYLLQNCQFWKMQFLGERKNLKTLRVYQHQRVDTQINWIELNWQSRALNVSYQGLKEYTEALVFDFSQRQDDVDQRTKQSQTFKHQANLHMMTHFHFSTLNIHVYQCYGAWFRLDQANND